MKLIKKNSASDFFLNNIRKGDVHKMNFKTHLRHVRFTLQDYPLKECDYTMIQAIFHYMIIILNQKQYLRYKSYL